MITKLLLAITIGIAAFQANESQQPFATQSSTRHLLPDSANLNEYVGSYKANAGGPVDQAQIELKDGKLFATAAGITTELMATSTPDVYTESQYGSVITFLRNDSKTVDRLQLVVDQMSLNITLTKQ